MRIFTLLRVYLSCLPLGIIAQLSTPLTTSPAHSNMQIAS